MTGTFWGFFLLFISSATFKTPVNIFPHFGYDLFIPVSAFLKLLGQHTLIRVLGKQFACNVVKHLADQGLLLQLIVTSSIPLYKV